MKDICGKSQNKQSLIINVVEFGATSNIRTSVELRGGSYAATCGSLSWIGLCYVTVQVQLNRRH